DPDLDDIVARIIAVLKWHGPFELEFILSTHGYGLIEFNPRFPAWCDFPSQIGANMPAAVVEMAFRRPRSEIAASVPGRLFIRHSIDLVGDISDVAEMAVTGSLHRASSVSENEVA